VEKPAFRGLVDRVLVVDCSPEIQIARLMSRDGETVASVRSILAAQANRSERLAAADDILLNETGVAALQDSVSRLHKFYLELAARGDFRHTGLRLP
jgi:dephospho-CoA kinase